MATFGKSSGSSSVAGLLLLVAVLVGTCASHAHAQLLTPLGGTVGSVSVVKLEVENQLDFDIEASITAPEAAGQEESTRVGAGETGDIQLAVLAPLTSAELRIGVYTSPLSNDPSDVYATTGSTLARVVANAGVRIVVVKFCTTTDKQDGVLLKGYTNPLGVGVNVEVLDVCAPKVSA